MAINMDVAHPGDSLFELVRSATSRIIIVAPYIKSAALSKTISMVPDTVSEFICVTRWLPEDIAYGSCDIEIFDDIKKQKGGKLLVHPDLHAKYYSNGEQSLVGSSNLTARGLGWHMTPNIELLVSLPASFEGLLSWEKALLESAIEATVHLRDQIHMQAEVIKQLDSAFHIPEVEFEATKEKDMHIWVPKCSVPDRLWDVYNGGGVDTMVKSALSAAKDDLAALSPPQGLSQDLFKVYLTGILMQMPLIAKIDEMASAGLTDTNAHDFLVDIIDDPSGVGNCEQCWQIIKHWLICFFPDTYRFEVGQEVLVKGKKITTNE